MFHDGESAKHFLEVKEIWGPWFSKLDPWNGQTLPLERVAWLKLCGIPLHLLDSDVLGLIGEAFRKVLHVPKLLEEDQDLSIVWVGVLVSVSSRIRDVVSLRWGNRGFRIWVEEDPVDWVPDCLARDDGSDLGDVPSAEAVPVESMQGSGDGEKEVGSPPGIGGATEGSPTFNVPFPQTNKSPLHEEREQAGMETCMVDGVSDREDPAGSDSKVGGDLGTIFNYDAFLGKVNRATSSEVGNKGMFAFKSGKKSNRCRKFSSKSQNMGTVGSPNCLLDSSEKSRPTKRNRAQVENVSGTCSHDQVQVLMKDIRGDNGLSTGEYGSEQGYRSGN
ncbi:hypothetical protein Hdeb2414_s0014g00433401 [Helianthus debilis subsp. tardiflorus]